MKKYLRSGQRKARDGVEFDTEIDDGAVGHGALTQGSKTAETAVGLLIRFDKNGSQHD
jgi:hypothetical protein